MLCGSGTPAPSTAVELNEETGAKRELEEITETGSGGGTKNLEKGACGRPTKVQSMDFLGG